MKTRPSLEKQLHSILGEMIYGRAFFGTHTIIDAKIEKAKQQLLALIWDEIDRAKNRNVETYKSLCGCPMCTYHTEVYQLKASKTEGDDNAER